MDHSSLPPIQTGYLGTYSSPQSAGIYRFTLDLSTGALTVPERYYDAPDSKYLSLFDGVLAAPVQGSKKAGVCLLDTTGETPVLLADDYQEETTSCFVVQDKEFLYAANYHQGTVLIYRKTVPALTLHKQLFIAPKAGCHQILFHSHYMLIPCLLQDRILIFDRDRDDSQIGEIPFARGTGPRHGIFSNDHRYFYVVSELSNELFVYQAGSDAQFPLQSVHPLFPQGMREETETPPASAAIRFSPDQRFLYISTRFADVISVFSVQDGSVQMIQQTGSGGVHPRDFVITEDGNFLLAANRTDGGLVCFRLDPKTGKIGPECSRVPAPEAVSIVLVPSKGEFQI